MSLLNPDVVSSSKSGPVLVYGRSRDGRIVHISEVPSGLACECKCAACGDALVARRGRVRGHHFAHYGDRECDVAGETALHLFAKQILQHALCVTLPEWRVSDSAETALIHRASTCTFDGAALECQIEAVVADVLLHKRDKELLVEILVTHACDEEKRHKLRSMGRAAIEIDLSAVPRDAAPDVVRGAVLYSAPRRWLANAKLEAVEASIRAQWERKSAERSRREEHERRQLERARQRAGLREQERLRSKARKIAHALRTKGQMRVEKSRSWSDCVSKVERSGLGSCIGIHLSGDASLSVEPHIWQAMIVEKFILLAGQRRDPEFSTEWVFKTARECGFVEPSCNGFMDKAVEDALLAEGVAVRAPYNIIRDFLKTLSAAQMLWRRGNHWFPCAMPAKPATALEHARDQRIF